MLADDSITSQASISLEAQRYISIGIAIGYLIVISLLMLGIHYVQKKGEWKRLTLAWKIAAGFMYLVFLAGGILIALYLKFISIGFTWIAVMVYIPLAAIVSLCKDGKFRWIVDLSFTVIILAAGIVLTIYKHEDAFLNINALFLGILLVLLPTFLHEKYKN